MAASSHRQGGFQTLDDSGAEILSASGRSDLVYFSGLDGIEAFLAFPLGPDGVFKEFHARMAQQSQPVQLTDEDITHLLTLLRNSAAPLTTQQLVDALKSRAARN